MTDLQVIKIAVGRIRTTEKRSQKEIGKLLGYSNESSFSQVLNGKVPLPPDLMEKVMNLNDDIKKFIIELKKESSPKQTKNDKNDSYIENQPNIFSNIMDQINKLINPDERESMEITPLYNRQISSQSLSKLGDERVMPTALLLNSEFRNCDLVIRHTDPAMTGYLAEKSYIGVKCIPKESYMNLIVPGKLYVIVFGEYVIERFLYEGSEGKFLAKAFDSKKNHDFEIPKKSIMELWLIKSWMAAAEVEPA